MKSFKVSIILFKSSGSQSVVPEPTGSSSPRNLLEEEILVPKSTLLNRKLWEWGPAIFLQGLHLILMHTKI